MLEALRQVTPREVEELRAQVEGLRAVIQKRVDACRQNWAWKVYKWDAEAGCLIPRPHDEACDACRDLREALSLTPAQHASRVFAEGMERAAEIAESERLYNPTGNEDDAYNRGVRDAVDAIRAEVATSRNI